MKNNNKTDVADVENVNQKFFDSKKKEIENRIENLNSSIKKNIDTSIEIINRENEIKSNAIQSVLSELKNGIKENQEKSNNLVQEIKNQETDIKIDETIISLNSDKKADIQKELDKLQKDYESNLKSFGIRIDSVTLDHMEKFSQYEKLDISKKELELDIEKVIKMGNSFEEDINILKKSLKTVKEQMPTGVGGFFERLNPFNQKKSLLSDPDLKLQANKLEEDIKNTEEDLKLNKKYLSDLRKQLGELNKQIPDIEKLKAIKNFQKEASDLESKLSQSTEEINSYQAKINKKKSSIEEIKKQEAPLKEKISSQENELSSLEKELKNPSQETINSNLSIKYKVRNLTNRHKSTIEALKKEKNILSKQAALEKNNEEDIEKLSKIKIIGAENTVLLYEHIVNKIFNDGIKNMIERKGGNDNLEEMLSLRHEMMCNSWKILNELPSNSKSPESMIESMLKYAKDTMLKEKTYLGDMGKYNFSPFKKAIESLQQDISSLITMKEYIDSPDGLKFAHELSELRFIEKTSELRFECYQNKILKDIELNSELINNNVFKTPGLKIDLLLEQIGSVIIDDADDYHKKIKAKKLYNETSAADDINITPIDINGHLMNYFYKSELSGFEDIGCFDKPIDKDYYIGEALAEFEEAKRSIYTIINHGKSFESKENLYQMLDDRHDNIDSDALKTNVDFFIKMEKNNKSAYDEFAKDAKANKISFNQEKYKNANWFKKIFILLCDHVSSVTPKDVARYSVLPEKKEVLNKLFFTTKEKITNCSRFNLSQNRASQNNIMQR